MKISELFTLIRASALKQLVVEDKDLLSFYNMGISELYKRFPINIKEQTIIISSDINVYPLNPDVMQIISVYTSGEFLVNKDGTRVKEQITEVVELPVNNEHDVNSIYTPTPGNILVPNVFDGQILSILYRASAVKVELEELNEEIQLSPQFIEPLLMYMAYLAHMSYDNASTQEHINFLQNYNISCGTIDKLGLSSKEATSNLKLKTRGFV